VQPSVLSVTFKAVVGALEQAQVRLCLLLGINYWGCTGLHHLRKSQEGYSKSLITRNIHWMFWAKTILLHARTQKVTVAPEITMHKKTDNMKKMLLMTYKFFKNSPHVGRLPAFYGNFEYFMMKWITESVQDNHAL